MDSFELDLCLSCGTHVADGSPYCSSRCRKADAHQQVSPSSSAPRSVYLYAASSSQGPSTSSHYHHYAPAHSNRRRPLLDLQDQPLCEEEQQVSNKLASIHEWAQGVYGASYDEDECLRMKAAAAPRRGSIPMASPVKKTKLPSKHTHSASLSPSRQYSPPRFALTAQGLAPPAMSIATVDDSDLSSIATPSTSPSAVVMIKDSRRKSAEMVDPWISSPPYEFAYKQTERGRPLVRV